MKETTPSAMPSCFERWCRRFDDVFKTKAEKQGFRQYLGGLLGESRRKNLSEMAKNAIWLPPFAEGNRGSLPPFTPLPN